MEHARVVIFEDQSSVRLIARTLLEVGNHEVVAEAATLDEALAVIDAIQRQEVACDVVLLDGNLAESDNEQQDGSDARTIYERMQHYGLPLRIIGLSSVRMEYYGIPVDADPGKARVAQLGNIIDELPDTPSR